MTNIGFLHTASVHVETFEALAQSKTLSTEHRVHAQWLQEAQNQGLNAALREQIGQELNALNRDCDVVICTCSTLGEIAAEFGNSRVFRVDAPMMAQAATAAADAKRGSGTSFTLLAYCLDSTKETSTALLNDAFNAAGQMANIVSVNCTAAWPHFEAADSKRFGQAIAERIAACLADCKVQSQQVSSVVLAQASMTAALPYLGADVGCMVLSSPLSAINHATALIRGN